VDVSVNGSGQSFAGVGRILIFGHDGNDDIQIVPGVRIETWALGGAGDDVIRGGGGTNVLVGGDGNDAVTGGPARDVLVGGRGADQLAGGGDDDLLAAGSTAFDANQVALDLVRAEWVSARAYVVRIDNLTGVGGAGANGPAVYAAAGPNPTVYELKDAKGFRAERIDVLVIGSELDSSQPEITDAAIDLVEHVRIVGMDCQEADQFLGKSIGDRRRIIVDLRRRVDQLAILGYILTRVGGDVENDCPVDGLHAFQVVVPCMRGRGDLIRSPQPA
jgi:hypothetical protein